MSSISGKARIGIVAVTLFLGVSALILGTTDWDHRLSSRVIDLLPSTDDSLEHRFMVGALQDRQADQLRFALTDLPADQLDSASRYVVDLVGQSPLFNPEVLTDREVIDRLANHLHDNRLTLLFPHWLAERSKEWVAEGEDITFHEWLANHTVVELDRFLASPDGFFFSELVGSDPLLLLLGLRDTFMNGTDSEGGQSVRTIQLSGSAFDPDNQELVTGALDGIATQLTREFPGSRLLVSGPVLFASHSRMAIRSEVRRVNLVSILLVLITTMICLRNPFGLIGLLPVVVCGLVGGLISVVLIFGRVHLMALVMGAFLSGITVDYGFHSFMHRAGEKESSLWKPLLVAVGSTGAGFAILLFASLPVIRQLGVFVTAGSICAFLAAVVLRPAIRTGFIAARPTLTRYPLFSRPGRKTILSLVVLMTGLTSGALRIEWHDDIRELDLPSPTLLATDKALQAMAGGPAEKTAFLTTGPSFLSAIERYRLFESDWMRKNRGPLVSLASVLPTPGELKVVRDFLVSGASEKWLEALMLELERFGYKTSVFEPFLREWSTLQSLDFSESQIEKHLNGLPDLLEGPTSFLMIVADGIYAVASMATEVSMDHGKTIQPGPHSIVASQLANLNHVFSRYRMEIWGFLLAGLSAVAVGVVIAYGIRSGIWILLLPVCSTLASFGVLGWMIGGLNLFHVLAGLLGFCLALDFSLFAWGPRQSGAPPPASVRVSGLTTLAAFSALALSRLPAVSALGLSVGLIVLMTLILVEVFGGAKTVDTNHAVEPEMG